MIAENQRYENLRKSMATVTPQIRKKFLRFLMKNALYEKYINNYISDIDNNYIKKFGDEFYYTTQYWGKYDIIAMSFAWSLTKEGSSVWDRMNMLFRRECVMQKKNRK